MAIPISEYKKILHLENLSDEYDDILIAISQNFKGNGHLGHC